MSAGQEDQNQPELEEAGGRNNEQVNEAVVVSPDHSNTDNDNRCQAAGQPNGSNAVTSESSIPPPRRINSGATSHLDGAGQFARVHANEPLIDGFILLRLAQLLNFDVYYICLRRQTTPTRSSRQSFRPSQLSESRQRLVPFGTDVADYDDGGGGGGGGEFTELPQIGTSLNTLGARSQGPWSVSRDSSNTALNYNTTDATDNDNAQHFEADSHKKNLMDELSGIWPIATGGVIASALRMLRIGLSLMAIMISVDKTISTILLCLISRPDIKTRPGNIGIAYESSDVSMSWLVLILLNISSMYILMSTVFNGHLLWQLLSQRLFLVSRRFQYKTMLSMFVFIYLEYIINVAFTGNLFGWSFETNESGGVADASGDARWRKSPAGGSGRSTMTGSQGNIVNSYSVLSNIKTFVTEKDETNVALDVLLTVFKFARGIIRIGPYITINYVTICLNEHIKTIRNQSLLTESLKRKQKLRMVVKNRRTRLVDGVGASKTPNQPGGRAASPLSNGGCSQSSQVGPDQTDGGAARKKRVIFVTEASANRRNSTTSLLRPPLTSNGLPNGTSSGLVRSPTSLASVSSVNSYTSRITEQAKLEADATKSSNGGCMLSAMMSSRNRRVYLGRIQDFNELEAYVTNLYIFTGRLNRLMSRLGLALFFIVHNLVITTTLIVPEAISGGSAMVLVVRLLVVLIGIVPFVSGQALDAQLEQLSKQIDRIIIKQQFINRKRDNLVRIRELLHDIRVNCGGMLNFNIETGIKYLLLAFATAFFIEQEDYKLTRRH